MSNPLTTENGLTLLLLLMGPEQWVHLLSDTTSRRITHSSKKVVVSFYHSQKETENNKQPRGERRAIRDGDRPVS